MFDKYTFEVHPDADKLTIKRAVRELFEREVKSVNVLYRHGKVKRTRYGTGKKPDKKIAIVTLKGGQEPLELF
jgi:large subunit ribosomal protein L23